ncbi:basic proline-rich protein-like [Venturia nashicola]|uniref:Basic proline-rich protein-like n=1 Tax=Venturia nashicola TaxID=86259 RepID=A0A4Z1PPJ5_9PEZI|nr:basic proline-rich protein-like [Venturia nashicola]
MYAVIVAPAPAENDVTAVPPYAFPPYRDSLHTANSINGSQRAAISINDSQRSAISINDSQRAAISINDSQRSAISINDSQRAAISINGSQRAAISINGSQRAANSINDSQRAAISINDSQRAAISINDSLRAAIQMPCLTSSNPPVGPSSSTVDCQVVWKQDLPAQHCVPSRSCEPSRSSATPRLHDAHSPGSHMSFHAYRHSLPSPLLLTTRLVTELFSKQYFFAILHVSTASSAHS